MNYLLLNTSTGARAEFAEFSDMLSAWLATPKLVMLTVGLTDTEKAVVARLYELHDELADSRRVRSSMTAAALRRYPSEEGVVL